MGAGVIACAEVAKAKAKPASVINLIIFLPPFLPLEPRGWFRSRGAAVPPRGHDFFEIQPQRQRARWIARPYGRRDSPGGKSCHSHKKERCSQHSRKKDSRSLHSLRMDSYCRRNTTHSRSQFRKTVRRVRNTPDSHSRRSTRQRRNQQHLQRLRRLYCEPHGDRTVAGRLQRSRVSAVDLLGRQQLSMDSVTVPCDH